MNTLSQIQTEVAALPMHLQAEVLDFVQFVKQRRALPQVQPNAMDRPADNTGDSPFFQALTEAGFVGCIDTDDQCATHYKRELDFSTKLGVQP